MTDSDQKNSSENEEKTSKDVLNKNIKNKDLTKEETQLLEKLSGIITTRAEASSDALESKAIFMARELEAIIDEYKKTFVDSSKALSDIKPEIDSSIKDLNDNNKDLNKLISVLALLPDKVSKHGVDLPEKVVAAINKNIPIMTQSITSAEIRSIESVDTQLTESISKMKKEMNSVVSSTKKELETFKSELKKEAGIAGNRKFSRFLTTIVCSVVLAAIAGGLSGRYVQKYFPKFVTIKGANNIKVLDSHVRITGGKESIKKTNSTKATPSK
jgi:hypothetical protein